MKYSARVLSCFPNKDFVEKWHNQLSSYLVDLSDEMNRLRLMKRIDDLNRKLSVVYALSKLDKMKNTSIFIINIKRFPFWKAPVLPKIL